MSLFNGSVYSQSLGMDTGLCVVLPYDRPVENQQYPCKVVYLLHGLGNRCDTWLRGSTVEVMAKEKGIALIMPEVQRSIYTDMAHGLKYFTYVSQELPKLCSRIFNISTKREDTFIAGLSMGGYGALKCAMTYPEQYSAAASFSGAVDLSWIRENLPDAFDVEEMRGIFGMNLEMKPQSDLRYLAEKMSKLSKDEQSKIFMTCGRQDYLYPSNIGFRNYMNTLPIPFEYMEWDGDHNWKFWEESIKIVLYKWMPTV